MNLTLIILALIQLESGGNPDARNGDCVGVLQLRPCYVADANRILGLECFTLADRESRVKSLRMARVVLWHYAKPEWGIIDFALCHKCGIKGMLTPGAEDLDYAERCKTLVKEMEK